MLQNHVTFNLTEIKTD